MPTVSAMTKLYRRYASAINRQSHDAQAEGLQRPEVKATWGCTCVKHPRLVHSQIRINITSTPGPVMSINLSKSKLRVVHVSTASSQYKGPILAKFARHHSTAPIDFIWLSWWRWNLGTQLKSRKGHPIYTNRLNIKWEATIFPNNNWIFTMTAILQNSFRW